MVLPCVNCEFIFGSFQTLQLLFQSLTAAGCVQTHSFHLSGCFTYTYTQHYGDGCKSPVKMLETQSATQHILLCFSQKQPHCNLFLFFYYIFFWKDYVCLASDISPSTAQTAMKMDSGIYVHQRMNCTDFDGLLTFSPVLRLFTYLGHQNVVVWSSSLQNKWPESFNAKAMGCVMKINNPVASL